MELMDRVHHITIAKDLLLSARLIGENKLFINCKVRYSRGYLILFHIAIEHLLKSVSKKEQITHDLKLLLINVDESFKNIFPPDTVEIIKLMNPFGFPVSGSERYPNKGAKSLIIDCDVQSKLEELSININKRFRNLASNS